MTPEFPPSAAPAILAFGPGAWPSGWVSGSPRYHLHGLAGEGWPVLYVEPAQARARRRLGRFYAAPPREGAQAAGSVCAWEDRPLRIFRPRARLFMHPRMPAPAFALRALNRLALARLEREVRAACALQPGLVPFRAPRLLWLGGWFQAPLLDRPAAAGARSVAFLYDDLPASPVWSAAQARLVAGLEHELIRRVDLAIFTSRPLLEDHADLAREGGGRALLLENAVDESFFEERLPPESAISPEDARALDAIRRLPAPRLGYLGAINLRLDADLCRALAREAAGRGWSLVFLGPVDPLYGRVAGELRALPNTHLPGILSPAAAPRALRLFEALLLPHARTPFTRAMFPEKLPEYLATGRPIVSTSLGEVVRVVSEAGAGAGGGGLVEFGDTPGEFLAACDRALAGGKDPGRAAARVALARRHTRALRLATLRRALEELLESPPRPRGGAAARS